VRRARFFVIGFAALAVFDTLTQVLVRLRSLPDAERRTKYLQSIPGTPPRLVDIEPGCRFATRCPLATPECRAWETELLAAPAGAHLVRCRRHDDARRPEAWPKQSYESE